MSLIRVYRNIAGETRLINLSFVSKICLYKNRIKMYKTSEREEINGNFLWFGGGGTRVEEILMNTDEEANKEFEDIQKSLTEWYKK